MRNEDISDHSSAEEMNSGLYTASDFKQALDEHAILSITGMDGKIVYVNRKFCDVSGYSKSELMGQDHRIINSGCHPKEFFKIYGAQSSVAPSGGGKYVTVVKMVRFIGCIPRLFHFSMSGNDPTNSSRSVRTLLR